MERGTLSHAERNGAIGLREPGYGKALRRMRSEVAYSVLELPGDGVPTLQPTMALASLTLLLDVPILRTTVHCLAPSQCNARRSANQRRGDLRRTCWQRSLTKQPPHS
jgi:hypothetical protein